MIPDSRADSGSTGRAFVTTHWSVVRAAGDNSTPDGIQALEKLCQIYWSPIYAYARRMGQSPADAEDLTQEFFARLIAKGFLKAAAPDRGRFRTFLLTAFKRYMANEWDRKHAAKRGGFSKVVPLDPELADARFGQSSELAPDLVYQRLWAMALLERTMALLKEEYLVTGRASLFEYLRPCLARDESALPYADIAARLNLTEAAVKMAVQRLRARYREILRTEIAQTVSCPDDVEEEIRDLFRAFSP